MSNWLAEEDWQAFQERTDKVAAMYSRYEFMPGMNLDGEQCLTEIVADLGGLSCMLEIARATPDFYYEEFFLAFTENKRYLSTDAFLHYQYSIDYHPADFLRANGNLQQVQEFYDTFGIQPGDGMYLPAEERVSVW